MNGRTRRLPTLLSEPMRVLGLVVMVDEIDKNKVRGLIDPLKSEFGVGDFAIGGGRVGVPAARAAAARPT